MAGRIFAWIVYGYAIIGGIAMLFFVPVFGILIMVGCIHANIFILRGMGGKRELIMNDIGLVFKYRGKIEKYIEWYNVRKVEVFDQAHNDLMFKVWVKEGMHFLPDNYDFRSDDMRLAFEELMRPTSGYDVEFVDHSDLHFA